jgi:lipoic acid synthetase
MSPNPTYTHTPLPPWIRKRLGSGLQYHATEGLIHTLGVQTICTQARCPNQGECWARGTATVLILGEICTRNCPFCAVAHGIPFPPDATEPDRVAQLTQKLGITYLVLTSVDRDDLADGGASHFHAVMQACRAVDPSIRFEILVPDFKGVQREALGILSDARPFVFSHNVETVPALYSKARPGGDYARSLGLLELAKNLWPETPLKSSLMLGLGETEAQVLEVLADLRRIGCDRICLGQYLKPTKDSLDVQEFVTPERFAMWADQARVMGFTWVLAEPFARSSYHAEQFRARHESDIQ